MVKNFSLVAVFAALAAAGPIQHEARQFPGVGLNVDKEGNVDLKPQSGVDVNVDPQRDGSKGANVGVNRQGVQVDRPQRRDPQFPGVGVSVGRGGNVDVRPQDGVDVNVDQQKDGSRGSNVGVNREGVSVGHPQKRALEGIERPAYGGGA
ncbi:hypothetical protein BKA81DRAFT_26054 [Phyllosticta paracitricarpa]|uniref:Uncharacterized protein n=2 Tax=Phyllosticta TaxID=121621 RepID=A0ABR1MEG5_9PEZI